MDYKPTRMSGHRWVGLFKLMEECGEVQQALGKVGAFPEARHPDGLMPKDRLTEELTDLAAAMDYFMAENGLTIDEERFQQKLQLFRSWGLTGV